MSKLLIIGGTGQIGLGIAVQARLLGMPTTLIGSRPLESRAPIYRDLITSMEATYRVMDVFATAAQPEFRDIASQQTHVVNVAEPYHAPKNEGFWLNLRRFYESLAQAGYTRGNANGKSFVRIGSPPAEIPSDEHARRMGVLGYVEDSPLPGEVCNSREFQTPYFRVKTKLQQLAAEMARSENLHLVSACPTTIIGAFGNHGDLELILRCLRGETPFCNFMVNFRANMVSLDAAAKGILLAAQKGKAGESYQIGGEELWLGQIFAGACHFAGQRPPRFMELPKRALAMLDVANAFMPLISRAPFWGDMVRGALPDVESLLDPSYVALAKTMMSRSSQKAREQLGYRPATERDIDMATIDMVLWYRKAGLI